MLVKLSTTLTLLFFYLAGFCQSVSIASPDEVCLNEVVSLQANTSGGVSSYSWNLGDNTTSTQKNPSHSYKIVGAKTVTLEVSFNDGTKLTDTKTITVHDLPKADFDLVNSSFCFNSQDVCLNDKSTMGSTTTGYATRLVLWGDGAQSISNSPASNIRTCYSSYPKPSNVPYRIAVEVKNDKGCEDKWGKDISILGDYVPRFKYRRKAATCDEQEVCFTNDSSTQNSNISSFEWDFGDGTAGNSTTWKALCHKYTVNGIYRATLRVTLKNGCVSTYSRVFSIKTYDFEVNPTLFDSVQCYPKGFTASHSPVPGATYSWQLFSKDTVFLSNLGFGMVQELQVPCPGDYLVKLAIRVGECSKQSRFFSIKSRGVFADFIILNRDQCPDVDTVYAVNTSKWHPEADVTYEWSFSDTTSPQNCVGWETNCNYDDDLNSRHLYGGFGCFEIKLIATDKVSGCVSELTDTASVVNPVDLFYIHELNRPCYGSKIEYGVSFTANNVCNGRFSICLDSLADDKTFSPLSGTIYSDVADSNGWVTVGLASEFGDEKVYTAPDTAAYYLDPSNRCLDTVWFHHWFQLHPEPVPEFSLSSDTTCLPITYQIDYTGDESERLIYYSHRWSEDLDWIYDTTSGKDLKSLTHTFYKEGLNTIEVVIEDTFGCYSNVLYKQSLGFQNEFVSISIICAGMEIQFIDNIKYFFDTTSWWRDTSNLEQISWDFDDGRGFVTKGSLPSYKFNKTGIYQVRMASVDKSGCADTAYGTVNVGNVIANMEDNSEDYLCDQIIQFFDSSYFSFQNSGDRIKSYYWDFGDNTKESYLKNPFHYYSKNGSFIVTLAVETDAGCKDTAQIPIYLKGPEPYFDILFDTVGCVPFTAEFKSNSKLVSSYNWYMGDDQNTLISSSNDTSFSFTYNKPGTYYIRLEGSDSFFNALAGNTYTCSAVFPDTASGDTLQRVVVLPIPQADFRFVEPVCVGQEVVFTPMSDSIYKSHRWRIRDGYAVTNGDYNFTFEKTGTYNIEYTPTYEPEGPYQRACFDTASYTVDVREVRAAFSARSEGICNDYIFTDSSLNATSYLWDFGQLSSGKKNTSVSKDTRHSYKQGNGTFTVSLIVQDEYGCFDTAFLDIESEFYKELNLYNVFTPNGDGFNDDFRMEVVNQSYFRLDIFNRYGELVFRTNDPNESWNGKLNNQENELPASTYFYIVDYQFNCDNKRRKAEGIVELIRP